LKHNKLGEAVVKAEEERGPETADRNMRLMGTVLYLALAGATGMLAVHFVLSGSFAWKEMNACLLAGTLFLAAAVLCHAVVTLSLRDACLFFTLSCGISLVAEYAGVHSGFPFGCRYSYHEHLVPQLAGCVPLFIPLSWFVLAYAPLVFLRGFAADTRGDSPRYRSLLVKAVLCALLLAATDLFLDPLATSVDAWHWAEEGEYLGIPVLNYLGWFLVGLLIYVSFFALTRSNGAGVGQSTHFLDASFVTFSIFFTMAANVALVLRMDNGVPAMLTAATTGPFWLYWFATARRATVST